jgi:hypothetical protein
LAGLASGGGYYCKRERRREKRLNGMRVSFWLLMVLRCCLAMLCFKEEGKDVYGFKVKVILVSGTLAKILVNNMVMFFSSSINERGPTTCWIPPSWTFSQLQWGFQANIISYYLKLDE